MTTDTNDKRSKGQLAHWAGLTAEERMAKHQRMMNGRTKAAKRRKRNDASATKSRKSSLSITFALAERAAKLLEDAGGRVEVDRLLDIVELIQSEDD